MAKSTEHIELKDNVVVDSDLFFCVDSKLPFC